MRHIPDVLAVAGVALVVFGVAMIHVPSAVILAGISAIYAGHRLNKVRA